MAPAVVVPARKFIVPCDTDTAWYRTKHTLAVQYNSITIDTNCKLYQHIRSLGQFNFNIELLEAYPCGSDLEMRCREQYWMDKQAVSQMLNQRRAVNLKKYTEYLSKDRIM